jgi:hypothetical protein
MLWPPILSLAVLLPSAEARADPPETGRKGNGTSIEIVAVVDEYRFGAMGDLYEDGTFRRFDATVLRVVSPKQFEGPLWVFHDRPWEEDSPWRAVTKSVRFRIDADMLDTSGVRIYSGAVSNLELIEKGKSVSIEIVAVVDEYRFCALDDQYEDGRFMAFDATVLRVVSPKQFEGPLWIYHPEPCTEESPWRAVSKSARLWIDRDSLEASSVQIFSGAVSRLELIEKEGGAKADDAEPAWAADCPERRSPQKASSVKRRKPPCVQRVRRKLPVGTRRPKTSD